MLNFNNNGRHRFDKNVYLLYNVYHDILLLNIFIHLLSQLFGPANLVLYLISRIFSTYASKLLITFHHIKPTFFLYFSSLISFYENFLQQSHYIFINHARAQSINLFRHILSTIVAIPILLYLLRNIVLNSKQIEECISFK